MEWVPWVFIPHIKRNGINMKQYKINKSTKHELVGVIFEYAILKDMQPPK
jgi:hypothetical protein